MWQAWDGLLHPGDLLVFAIVYVLTGLGVTVGFHRLFTHRSFKAHPAVRATLAVLGSAAIEGPAISWVADHRKHHAFSDQLGDPHSPHVDHGVGLARRAARPAARAHGLAVPPRPARLAGALRAGPARRPGRCASSTGPSSCGRSAGLALPFALGVAIGGSVRAGADRPAVGRRA